VSPSDAEVVRRSETLEALVGLYLRLNGYLSITNYLQHRTAAFGLEAESDVLALRMPHQEEELPDGRLQPNDEILMLPKSPSLIDCIIAEVKEPAIKFNKTMRGPDGAIRIAQAIRMFGMLPHEAFKTNGKGWKMSEELHRAINAKDWPTIPQVVSADDHLSVRMIVFAPHVPRLRSRRAFIDLHHVFGFVRERMIPAGGCSAYRGPEFSPWRGTARLIVAALDEAYITGVENYGLGDLIRDVLKRWPE
jgi:hypothetical protein